MKLAALKRLGVRDLRDKFAEVYGDTTPSGTKAWLIKRITWRKQALAEEDLPERARRRAAELANDADLRVIPPPPIPVRPSAADRTKAVSLRLLGKRGLPAPGMVRADCPTTRGRPATRATARQFARPFLCRGQHYLSGAVLVLVVRA